MTREQAIEMLVSMDVARWGEEERAEAVRVHSGRTLGLALNELANRIELDLTGGVDVGLTASELRAWAGAAMTASDRATLRQGG